VPTFSQDLNTFSRSIASNELKKHIEYLASDELGGRNTGDPGQKLAAAYIKDWFTSLHLTAPVTSDEPFYQKFDLYGRKCTSSLLCNNRDTLDNLSEYMMDNGEEEFEGSRDFRMIFLGYGLERDYRDVDVKGKIVMYFNGFPASDSIKSLSYLKVTDEKYDRAMNHGAAGAIKLFKDSDSAGFFIRAISGFGKGRMRLKEPYTRGIDSVVPNGIGMLPESGARLLGISYETLLQDLKTLDGGKPVPHFFETTIHLESRFDNYQVHTENVLGFLKGKKHPDEVLILMAHYDHVGIDQGEVCHGANDNASGTAAVLEVAKALIEMGKAGYQPDKSILFLLVTAEEKGLIGSEYYVANPIIPLDRTTQIVNLDMLGRSDKKHKETDKYIYIDMADSMGSRTHQICQSLKTKLDLGPLNMEYGFSGKTFAMGSSDHLSFSSGKIPFVYYYNGTHRDWHKPTDTADKIDYQELTAIVRHIFATVWSLANVEEGRQ
jgi:hypothetical protein